MTARTAFVTRYLVQPSHRADLLSTLKHHLDGRGDNPDFLTGTLHCLHSDPHTLIVYEAWRCDKATYLSSHQLPPSERDTIHASLPALLTDPLSVEWLQPFSEHVRGRLTPAVMGDSFGLWVH